VATHDTEFAASFADRVVLLGQGTVIGDGPPVEVLGGGRHFSTEVARVTGGAALLPDEAARILATGRSPETEAAVDGVRPVEAGVDAPREEQATAGEVAP
jgi:ABC-type sulfate/molybdate transport systems ATPase subunit